MRIVDPSQYKVAENVAALRALVHHEDGSLITVKGSAGAWDPWRFDANSLAADNGTTVAKPNNVGGGSRGRWLRVRVQATDIDPAAIDLPATTATVVVDEGGDGDYETGYEGFAAIRNTGGVIHFKPGSYDLVPPMPEPPGDPIPPDKIQLGDIDLIVQGEGQVTISGTDIMAELFQTTAASSRKRTIIFRNITFVDVMMGVLDVRDSNGRVEVIFEDCIFGATQTLALFSNGKNGDALVRNKVRFIRCTGDAIDPQAAQSLVAYQAPEGMFFSAVEIEECAFLGYLGGREDGGFILNTGSLAIDFKVRNSMLVLLPDAESNVERITLINSEVYSDSHAIDIGGGADLPDTFIKGSEVRGITMSGIGNARVMLEGSTFKNCALDVEGRIVGCRFRDWDSGGDPLLTLQGESAICSACLFDVTELEGREYGDGDVMVDLGDQHSRISDCIFRGDGVAVGILITGNECVVDGCSFVEGFDAHEYGLPVAVEEEQGADYNLVRDCAWGQEVEEGAEKVVITGANSRFERNAAGEFVGCAGTFVGLDVGESSNDLFDVDVADIDEGGFVSGTEITVPEDGFYTLLFHAQVGSTDNDLNCYVEAQKDPGGFPIMIGTAAINSTTDDIAAYGNLDLCRTFYAVAGTVIGFKLTNSNASAHCQTAYGTFSLKLEKAITMA